MFFTIWAMFSSLAAMAATLAPGNVTLLKEQNKSGLHVLVIHGFIDGNEHGGRPGDFSGWGQFIQRVAEPVSYTHLDVYKRQPLFGDAVFKRKDLMCGRRQWLKHTENPFPHRAGTVSYTHLDVYKRQMQRLRPFM